MGADLRQDAVTDAVSTSLAAMPRFTAPRPSREVADMLVALIRALPDTKDGRDEASLLLAYCPKARARRAADLPAWIREMIREYKIKPGNH